MFKTMSEVRAANRAAGYNWFRKDTMRFWKSKIETGLLKGQYFVSSEDEWAIDGRKPKRIYAVRQAHADGHIETLISHLTSLESAREYIKDLDYPREVPTRSRRAH